MSVNQLLSLFDTEDASTEMSSDELMHIFESSGAKTQTTIEREHMRKKVCKRKIHKMVDELFAEGKICHASSDKSALALVLHEAERVPEAESAPEAESVPEAESAAEAEASAAAAAAAEATREAEHKRILASINKLDKFVISAKQTLTNISRNRRFWREKPRDWANLEVFEVRELLQLTYTQPVAILHFTPLNDRQGTSRVERKGELLSALQHGELESIVYISGAHWYVIRKIASRFFTTDSLQEKYTEIDISKVQTAITTNRSVTALLCFRKERSDLLLQEKQTGTLTCGVSAVNMAISKQKWAWASDSAAEETGSGQFFTVEETGLTAQGGRLTLKVGERTDKKRGVAKIKTDDPKDKKEGKKTDEEILKWFDDFTKNWPT